MKVQQYNINTKSVGGKSIIAIHQGSRCMYIYLIIKCKLINYLFKKIQGLLNARNAIYVGVCQVVAIAHYIINIRDKTRTYLLKNTIIVTPDNVKVYAIYIL